MPSKIEMSAPSLAVFKSNSKFAAWGPAQFVSKFKLLILLLYNSKIVVQSRRRYNIYQRYFTSGTVIGGEVPTY